MKNVWLVLVAVCAVGNAMWVAYDWHVGVSANWFVWGSSILFSLDVLIDCVGELLD